MTPDDDVPGLYDLEEAKDPEVAALERAMAADRGRTDAFAAHAVLARARAEARARVRRWTAAAALVLALGAGALAVAWRDGGRSTGPGSAPAAPLLPETASAPVARVRADDGRTLAAGTWVEARGAAQTLDLGAYGHVTLADGARVQVAHVGQETTRLFLERGSLEAQITLAARPRFFQVDTSAARCVDLGCHYVLSVDAAGVAHVRVTSGQVAFEHEGREVLVPSGATCVARPVGGPGTPRFADADPELAKALDAFDGAPPGPERTRLWKAALARARTARELLPAWHGLADPDADVAAAALEALYGLGTRPDGYLRPAGRPGPADQAAWKELLESQW